MNSPICQGKTDIRGILADELDSRLHEWGEPAYRVRQVLDWVHKQRATGWEQMTNLPQALRIRLDGEYTLRPFELVTLQGSGDTTQKFLWRLADGSMIECVLIPANPALYGDSSDRRTLCVSTQVGCAYGCKFCASGLAGWKRNLESEEIVEQVLAVERRARDAVGDSERIVPERVVNNLVIMGMGEPLANYDNLLRALTILNAPWGGEIGARKITVSTSGLAPQIRRLADEPLQLRLAISLHGAVDEVRERIMPVNRKFPLSELTAACEYYQEKKGKMITLEYILIEGVNDGMEQARPLAELCRRLNAKVNLIPYNTVEGLGWRRPRVDHQEKFLNEIRRLGAGATLRREKGGDIDAACGQLRLKTEVPAAGALLFEAGRNEELSA